MDTKSIPKTNQSFHTRATKKINLVCASLAGKSDLFLREESSKHEINIFVRALVHEKIPRLFFPIFFPFLRRKQVNSNNMTIHNCNTLVLKVPNYLINCHNVCFLLFSSKKRIKMGKKRRGIFSCTRALNKRKMVTGSKRCVEKQEIYTHHASSLVVHIYET